MNIKEVEERTGLKAANIRYYEQEGLLHPERNRRNNYREYSQEDVEALERIKMLRMLDVPLREIAELQRKKVTLPKLMEEREQALSEEIKRMEQLKAVCRRVKMSGNSFEDLDAAEMECDFTYYNRKKDSAAHQEKIKRLAEKEELARKAVVMVLPPYWFLHGVWKIMGWQWAPAFSVVFVIADFCLIAYWIALRMKLHRLRCREFF